jgi:hypothetical protein
MQAVVASRSALLVWTLLAASGEAKGAIRYLPESTEVVLKAAQIAQLRIDRVDAPAWGALLMRQPRVHLKVTEVWKGRLSPGIMAGCLSSLALWGNRERSREGIPDCCSGFGSIRFALRDSSLG